MTPTLIENLENAWRVGLAEFISQDPMDKEKSYLTSLLGVVANVRIHNLLREGKPESFVRRVYDDIRGVPNFYLQYMSAATTFMLALENPEETMQLFCKRVELYTDKSTVVDNTTLQRKAPTTALTDILSKNPWLFMACVGSTLERATIEVLVANGRSK